MSFVGNLNRRWVDALIFLAKVRQNIERRWLVEE
jgi:hypothetical protein